MAKIGNDLLMFGRRKPWLSLISLILIAFGGLVIGQFVAIFLVTKIYHLSMLEVMDMVANISQYPDYKMAIYLLQGLSAIFAFILAPWFYLRYVEKKQFSMLSPDPKIELLPVILSILISIIFMAVFESALRSPTTSPSKT